MKKPTDPRFIDLTGKVYGKWTVISYAGKLKTARGYGPSLWLCRCQCGNERVVQAGNMKIGGSTQCAECYYKEQQGDGCAAYKHGHSPRHGRRSPTYESWTAMLSRCTYTSDSGYPEYGGRGIRVCQRWKSFENFVLDMGDRVRGTTIDRANYDESTRHYSCGKCEQCRRNGWVFHCRWATDAEQSRNRSTNFNLTFNGRTQCVLDWSREIGVPEATLRARIKKLGWSVEKALSTPLKRITRFN